MIKTTFLDYFGGPFLVAIFLLLLFLQWKFPLRRQDFSKLRRFIRNALFSCPVSTPDRALGCATSFRLVARPTDPTLAQHSPRRVAHGLSLLVVARRAPSRASALAFP